MLTHFDFLLKEGDLPFKKRLAHMYLWMCLCCDETLLRGDKFLLVFFHIHASWGVVRLVLLFFFFFFRYCCAYAY